jgi:hypothetical protein
MPSPGTGDRTLVRVWLPPLVNLGEPTREPNPLAFTV